MSIFNVSGTRLDDIVNVKNFGATGNGTTDDAQAIQDAIEYSKNNGGIVYFPKGTYLLSTALFNPSISGIASALMCYDGQVLLGERNAVLKIGAPGVTHTIFTYNTDSATGYTGAKNIEFRNLTFNGNSSLSNSITHLNITHASNIIVDGCQFTNIREWHGIEINSSTNVKVSNCLFYGNSTGSYREDIQIDAATGNGNLGSDDSTVCTDIEIFNCKFSTNGYPGIGNHSDYAHSDIRIHDNVFVGGGGTRGYIAFVASTGKVDMYNNTFYDSANGVILANTTSNSTLHDNRFYNNTTPYSGGIVAYNNFINGTFTA